MNTKKVYLKALAYELGELHSIDEVSELKEDPQVLNTLLTLGLDKYSKSSLTLSGIAKISALKTMEKAPIIDQDIDVLLYATNSFRNFKSTGLAEICHLIDELSLERAYPIGINLSECGNLQAAIRVGTSLIKSEDCNNVLIVTTDKGAVGGSRIISPNISVTSDAAASFILTNSETDAEFEMVCNKQHMNPGVSYIDPMRDGLQYLEAIMEGIKKTSHMTLIEIGKEPKDFRKLIINNYNTSVTKTICDILEFDHEQVYSKNIPRFAHAWASDNIINLYDFLLETPLLPNDLIMLIGTGTSAWGCTVLSKI
ncbi:3-oxoacyl-(acyl-carrier-protein) synthase III (plasmid) [Cylindrospermum stagnale PCC 7417]|uniref:3-oxoacyl-(Acyl-carrier-protein) synthase III n=1 Tax=Cylindrospermum stagnale PCC 7417 TaxID=56107 RepID=K9X9B9_9NOST|nr:3-oxoacyl-[acyl-carrier-protein] synthase III C-terminal domain-containing protein [Cylindrospermum stagnale]AFZ28262.1 3-oxoacyl-(acyl-carrier-protein) synthase III [Cylindrospermum stagnale PCC 7417]